MAAGDQVAVPAEHGLGAHEQSDPAQHVAGESVQQGSEEGPVSRGEPDLLAMQLSFEVFDPATNRFTPGPTMGTERYKITDAVAATDGGLIVAGGTQVETYDARSARFLPVPGSQWAWRSFPTVTALPDGSTLVVGGYDDHIRVHRDAAVFRPVN